MKYKRREVRIELISMSLAPKDKYLFFQETNLFSSFCTLVIQTDFGGLPSLRGRPKYIKGVHTSGWLTQAATSNLSSLHRPIAEAKLL
ncbi:hypothetical protein COCNU_12G001340 [Cocos nucifera]|uniref:Uncharacterized protein n=1 Tax=Cocos nucifera TaxID=13894 RepID=A0A8K0N9P4_COCNU|nr:hypothetical protein COCNU_12G001340 [Cocos nucifera]